MIEVPRGLITRSTAELSKLPGWKRHPHKSLKRLIYGLNSIVHRYPLLRYRHGFPRPSVTIRELERIHGLCTRAKKTRECGPLAERIEVLIKRDTDSYGLLLFQAAQMLEKGVPERAVADGRALEYLREVARTRPKQLADMCARAVMGLREIARRGRGGARNVGPQEKKDLIRDLGLLFENVTGRRPGVTYNAYKSSYSGPFVQFARIAFEALGRRINGRQINLLLRTIRDTRSGK